MRRVINRANIVLVALDENNTPTVVPQLRLENDIQREEFMLARQRRELRFKQEKQILIVMHL